MLLRKLQLDESSLPSILIGNIITSVIKKHPKPLQIGLAVLFHKKKTVMHMHDYRVCCSYDELLRFKRSSAVNKYNKICIAQQQPMRENRLVQVVVDNFDATLSTSSPNGKVSTHDMATIEIHSKPPTEPVEHTIPRISKVDMTRPICSNGDDRIITYSGADKPVPPHLSLMKLPAEFLQVQRLSQERAGNMDFTFLKVPYHI